MSIYTKVFGENHGKDLWKLSVEDQKLLTDARSDERTRRSKRTRKIVANNTAGGKSK